MDNHFSLYLKFRQLLPSTHLRDGILPFKPYNMFFFFQEKA